MTTRTFCIPGRPAPKGSRVSGRTRDGRTYSRESNPRVKAWMNAAATLIQAQNRKHGQPLHPPYQVAARFTYRTPKRAKYDYPSQGDIDKLARSLLDALGPDYGAVLTDDRHVVALTCTKAWGTEDVTIVTVMGNAE